MKVHHLVPSVVVLALLAGCAMAPPQAAGPQMIPGRMYSLKDGTEFRLQIERSSGHGLIVGENLATGERFTGTYSAMITEGGNVEQSTHANNWGTTTGTVVKTTAATRAVGRAILRGDKGTIITLTLDIKPSYHPHINPSGFGDGEDNHGVKYQVQFG